MPEKVLVQQIDFVREDKTFQVKQPFIVDKEKLKYIAEVERQSLKEFFKISDEDEIIGGTGCRKVNYKVDVFFQYMDCNGTPIDHWGLPPSRINVDVLPLDHGDRSIIKMSLTDENIDDFTIYVARSKMISTIVSEVCKFYGVDEIELFKNSRIHKFVFSRQVVSYFLYRYRTHYKMSLSDIGNVFKQNHATVLHNVKVVEDRASVYEKTKEEINELKSMFDHKFMQN